MSANKRSDTELNRIIAEWHYGYEDFDQLKDHLNPPRWEGRKLFGSHRAQNKWEDVLSYCTDLNAIHEAEEKVLSNVDTGYAYDCELNIICGCYEDGVMNYVKLRHATARERAEALVNVISALPAS